MVDKQRITLYFLYGHFTALAAHALSTIHVDTQFYLHSHSGKDSSCTVPYGRNISSLIPSVSYCNGKCVKGWYNVLTKCKTIANIFLDQQCGCSR